LAALEKRILRCAQDDSRLVFVILRVCHSEAKPKNPLLVGGVGEADPSLR
jgi:hypothetical protein